MKHIIQLSSLLISIACFQANAQHPIMGTWKNTGPVNFPMNLAPEINGLGRVTQIKFHPTNAQKMYAVSAGGGLYISNNNGVTWAPTAGTEQLPATTCASVCVDYTNDNIIYLSTGDPNYYTETYGIWKSTDGGQTWNPSNTGIGDRMAVEILMDPTNTGTLVAATDRGIWKSTDAGATWSQKQAGAFTDMKLKPGSNTTLHAVTKTQYFRSIDFGNTWTAITNGIDVPTTNGGMRVAVTVANPGIVYIATTDGNGLIFRSTDGGSHFATMYNSTTQCLNCYSANPGSGTQGDYNMDIAVNPLNADEIFLAALNLWGSVDGGVTWTMRSEWAHQVHTDMHHIEFNPHNNTQFFNANDGGVFLSTDPVASIWSPRSDGLAANQIYHAAQSQLHQSMMFTGSQDNGGIFLDYDGIWKTVISGDLLAKVAFDYLPGNNVYLLAHFAHDVRRRKLTPLEPAQSFNSPIPVPSKMAFNSKMPEVSFIGDETVYRTTNLSAASPAWSLIGTFNEKIMDMVSSTADSNILYIVTDAQHFYRSDNALSANPTFVTINTPSFTQVNASIASNKNDANIVYLSCNNAVYRSADKGATWANITSNLPPLNINKIIHDEYSTNERLFLNSGSNVYYKTNTMPWTNHSNNHGLPSVANATDFMIYNNGQAGSVLRLATFGRGVWEVPIYDNPTVSIGNINNENHLLSAYPNPANDQITFTFTGTGTAKGTMAIHDVSGRIVKQVNDIHLKDGSNSFQCNVADLSNGIYEATLMLTTGSKHSIKISIKK
jgi:photosystem II stability/assembly factor-like uncharacterized protein